jgi:hypothetical protein
VDSVSVFRGNLLSRAQSIELVPISGHLHQHKTGYIKQAQHKIKISPTRVRRRPQNTWNEAKVLQNESDTSYREYKQSAHMSLIDHPISEPSLDISPIWTPVITAVDYVSNLCFYVGATQRICLFSDDFYSDSALISTTIAAKQCMDIGARTHICRVFF